MEFFHRNPQGISALFHRLREHGDSSLSELNTIGCVAHVAQISTGIGHILLDDLNMTHLLFNHTHSKHTQI